MVTPRVIHRDFGGKQFYRRVHKTVEDMVFLVKDRNHITVENKEVSLFQITFGNQIGQDIIFSVYVIHHRERYDIISRITCLEDQRLLRIDIR